MTGEAQAFETIVCPASAAAPRQTEGSVIQLTGGELLLAWSEFYAGDAHDAGPARICGKISADLGRTWGEPFVLQPNDGRQNVMSASLLRLAPKGICLFYLRKNSSSDLHVYMRRCDDEGSPSWGGEIRVTAGDGYHVMNNDRVVKLTGGRLVAPIARCDDVLRRGSFASLCYYSDDGGRTWQRGKTHLELPDRGAMEPGVVELRDGRLLMVIRTQLGRIYRSYSSDAAVTWSPAEPMDIISPEAPSSIARLPGGELLLVWNNDLEAAAGLRGRRTPLTCAISRDEGQTWEHPHNLEDDPRRVFAYTSIAFVGPPAGPGVPQPDRAIFTYYSAEQGSRLYSLKLKSVPLSWFYE